MIIFILKEILQNGNYLTLIIKNSAVLTFAIYSFVKIKFLGSKVNFEKSCFLYEKRIVLVAL